jgi:hypothetical protein
MFDFVRCGQNYCFVGILFCTLFDFKIAYIDAIVANKNFSRACQHKISQGFMFAAKRTFWFKNIIHYTPIKA